MPLRAFTQKGGSCNWGFILLVVATSLWAGAGASDPESRLAQRATEDDPVTAMCRRISSKLASVSLAECLAIGLELSGAEAVSGAPILMKEYPPLPGREPLGRILLVGGIHGDEYSSVTIVVKWMAILNRYHSGLFHWRISPLMNPDGLFKRRSTRMNENRVDLNRNFPCPNWFEATREYWIGRTLKDPRRYPGRAALSEPESRWLAEEIETFRPAVIVSVHAPYGVLDFDGPLDPPERFGNLHLKLLGTYPGSLGRYAGVIKGIPVLTIELPSAGVMPAVEEQNRIWRDLIRWLKGKLPVSPSTKVAP